MCTCELLEECDDMLDEVAVRLSRPERRLVWLTRCLSASSGSEGRDLGELSPVIREIRS